MYARIKTMMEKIPKGEVIISREEGPLKFDAAKPFVAKKNCERKVRDMIKNFIVYLFLLI